VRDDGFLGVVPKDLHNSLRLYLTLKTHQASHECGRIARYDAIDYASEKLEVSTQTVYRMLSRGEGVFWRLHDDEDGSSYVYLKGWQAVYHYFGQRLNRGVRLLNVTFDDLKGHVANFRAVVAAVKVRGVCSVSGEVVMSRDELCDILDVSRPTLRKYIELGWIQRVQRVNVYEEKEIIKWGGNAMAIEPVLDGELQEHERCWHGKDSIARVVQEHNVYASRFNAPLDQDEALGARRIHTAKYMWVEVPELWSGSAA
jgi:hypothetical protein